MKTFSNLLTTTRALALMAVTLSMTGCVAMDALVTRVSSFTDPTAPDPALNLGWSVPTLYELPTGLTENSVTMSWKPSKSIDLAKQVLKVYRDGNCSNVLVGPIELDKAITSHSVVFQVGTFSFQILSSDFSNNESVSACSGALYVKEFADLIPPVAATGLGWNQSDPTSSNVLKMKWDHSTSVDRFKYEVQIFTGATCNVAYSTSVLLDNWITSYDSASVPQGTYSFKIKTLDTSNNPSFSICSSKMVVDLTPPTIAITSPNGASPWINITNNGINFAVSGTCSEVGRNVVIGVVSGPVLGSVSCLVGGSFSISINTTTMPDGNLSIAASTTDLAGNAATSGTVSVVKDATRPTVAISHGAIGVINSSGVVSYSLVFSDANLANLNAVQIKGGLSIVGASAGCVISTPVIDNVLHKADFTVSNCSGSGQAQVSVAMSSYSDLAGNGLEAKVDSFQFSVDNTPPTVFGVTSTVSGCNAFSGKQYCSKVLNSVVTIQVQFSESITASSAANIQLSLANYKSIYSLDASMDAVMMAPVLGPVPSTLNNKITFLGSSVPSTPIVLTAASVSGDKITFSYTVDQNQNSDDLEYSATNALSLINAATIKDAVGNNASLVLPNPGAAGSLSANSNVVIDTTKPLAKFVDDQTALKIDNGMSVLISNVDYVDGSATTQVQFLEKNLAPFSTNFDDNMSLSLKPFSHLGNGTCAITSTCKTAVTDTCSFTIRACSALGNQSVMYRTTMYKDLANNELLPYEFAAYTKPPYYAVGEPVVRLLRTADPADTSVTIKFQIDMVTRSNSVPSAQFSGGMGTAASPFKMATLDDLYSLSYGNNYYNMNILAQPLHYQQVADIDFGSNNSHVLNAAGTQYTKYREPQITGNGTVFKGVYDGNGFTIKDFWVNTYTNTGSSFPRLCGLFGTANGATIKNVKLVNAKVSNYVARGADFHVGLLVGQAFNSTIDNVHVEGEIQNLTSSWTLDAVTGLPGQVASDFSVGGLVGSATNSTITRSSAKVVIQAPTINPNTLTSTQPDFTIGGLVGELRDSAPSASSVGVITHSFASGSIDSVGTRSGGLVGFVTYATNISNNWTAMTSIKATTFAGGLIGRYSISSLTLDNVTAAAAVASLSKNFVVAAKLNPGPLSVFDASPQATYTGAYVGFFSTPTGYVVNFNAKNYFFSNGINHKHQTSGNLGTIPTQLSTNSTGLSNAAAINQATYSELNFASDWKMSTTNNYTPSGIKTPVLQWQCAAGDANIVCP